VGRSADAEAVIKRELKINITDADAKKYYDDNPARFEQPEMVRASHILLTTRDPARERSYPTTRRPPSAKTRRPS